MQLWIFTQHCQSRNLLLSEKLLNTQRRVGVTAHTAAAVFAIGVWGEFRYKEPEKSFFWPTPSPVSSVISAGEEACVYRHDEQERD